VQKNNLPFHLSP